MRKVDKNVHSSLDVYISKTVKQPSDHAYDYHFEISNSKLDQGKQMKVIFSNCMGHPILYMRVDSSNTCDLEVTTKFTPKQTGPTSEGT